MTLKRRDENPTVYSTSSGSICPTCGNPIDNCTCLKVKNMPKGDGIIRISLDRKGRKGKQVTVARGFLLSVEKLQKLSRELKKKCGSGGSVKENTIEIQGDHRKTLMDELGDRGYKVKLAGG